MITNPTGLKHPPALGAGAAFFSDFDGTLVELAAHPDEVAPAAGLPGWLQQLEQQLGGALAIVTGRRLAQVDRHLAPLLLMGAGAHGAEVRAVSGGPTSPIVAPLPPSLVTAIESALADLRDVWVENKTFALAAHFRQNPAAEPECLSRVRSVAASFSDVAVFNGHCVVELRVRGVSKGATVQALLTRSIFADRVPVFVGDDMADEEAFIAVQAAGGHGVKVGAGETHAHYRLDNVAAVHRWMCESLMRLRRES